MRLQSSTTLIAQDEELHFARVKTKKMRSKKEIRVAVLRAILKQEQIKTEKLIKAELDMLFIY